MLLSRLESQHESLAVPAATQLAGFVIMYNKTLSDNNNELEVGDNVVIKADNSNLENMLYYRDEGNVSEIACNRMQLISFKSPLADEHRRQPICAGE